MRKFLALALLLIATPAAQAVTFHDLPSGATNAACEVPVWQGGSGGGAYKFACTAFFAGLPGLSSDSAFRAAIGAVTGPGSSTNGNIATFSGTGGKTVQDSGKATPSGAVVGTTDTQTITNKTVSGASNTVSGPIGGTSTNDSAAAGKVGEYVSSSVASGSAVSLAVAGTDTNITSISLSAGDWDVNGAVIFGGTSSNVTLMIAGVNSTSAAQPSQPTTGRVSFSQASAAASSALATGQSRFSLSATTTVYLIASCVGSSGTCTGFGALRARRSR